MSKIFEQGAFSRYSKRSLENATSPILEHSQFSAKTTVFISHRHDDLEDLQGVLGFLEDEYKVKVYIDIQMGLLHTLITYVMDYMTISSKMVITILEVGLKQLQKHIINNTGGCYGSYKKRTYTRVYKGYSGR